MNKEKTILFVMPRLPFPAVSGRKTSLYHYCRILSQELGYRLVVAAFLESGDNPNLKPDFIDKLVILDKPLKKEKINNIIFKSIIKGEQPLQVSLFLSKRAMDQVDSLIENEKPKIIISDMVRCTEYIRDRDIYSIADLDDRISLRYKRQLNTDIDNVNPYGAFIYTLPKFLQKIALLKPLKVFVLKREIKLLDEYELEIGKSCDKTVFVAEKEVNDFNSQLKENKAVAVPIGVDVDYFVPIENLQKRNVISFLGALNVAHNENAVINFIENILPLVLQRQPDTIFTVIGGGASDKLLSYSSSNVVFTGRVDDVRDYLAHSKVFVCPMTFGSGIKTKNLEAMAMGLPVITTTIGAENINAVNGVDWFVEDKYSEFANCILNILNNQKLQNDISTCARKYILNNFTWEVAKNNFENLLNIE